MTELAVGIVKSRELITKLAQEKGRITEAQASKMTMVEMLDTLVAYGYDVEIVLKQTGKGRFVVRVEDTP